MAQITISPTKNGQNHHHQVDPQITNHQEKPFKSPSIFSIKMTVFSPFCSCFRHVLITKLPTKNGQITTASQNHQFFQVLITKSLTKKLLNHHHHKSPRSPNHQFFQVQITNKKTIPITKNTAPPYS